MKNLAKRYSFLTALLGGLIFLPALKFAVHAEVENSTDCSLGSTDLDKYFCYREDLVQFEDKLADVYKRSVAITNSDWGNEATKEIKARMDSAQKAWFQYRNDQCLQGYYTKATVHPPSESLAITLCKISKTKERINEIEDLKNNSNVCENVKKLIASKKEKHRSSDQSLELEKFIIPDDQKDTAGSNVYNDLDIDGDKVAEKITKSCGSGVGQICTLSVKYSKSNETISSEFGPVFLGRLANSIYLIEEINGSISPYTDQSSISVYSLESSEIEKICQWKDLK